jgi:small conductance mechanosensitive channel
VRRIPILRQIVPSIQFTVLQIGIQVSTELLLRLATAGLVLLATWIASRILGGFVSKTLGKISPSVAHQGKQIIAWLTWLTGILIALSQLGAELTVLLVIVSLGGVILAVAIRDVLSNVASNRVITSYRPFRIGDWIEVGKHFGRVVDITWMDTVLMTPDNEMVHIPNSKITQTIVTNKTTPGGTRISVPVTVDKTLDIANVEKIFLEVGAELVEELIPDSKPEVRLISLDGNAMRVALLLRINNPAKGKLLASEVRKRIKTKLDKAQAWEKSSSTPSHS